MNINELPRCIICNTAYPVKKFKDHDGYGPDFYLCNKYACTYKYTIEKEVSE